MKLRKAIAIILMTLANLVILAHGAMPHHHHEGRVCFNAQNTCCDVLHLCSDSLNCCVAGEAGDCAESSHQAHHDTCDLPQVVERDGRSIIDGFSSFHVDKNNFAVDACLCILCYACNQLNVELDKATFCKYSSYTTYIENYTSPYVGAAFGLRAPPTQSLA